MWFFHYIWLLSGFEALNHHLLRANKTDSIIIMYVRLHRRPNDFTNQWAETLSLKRPADHTNTDMQQDCIHVCHTQGKESNNGSVRLDRKPIATSQWLKNCRDADWTRHVTVVDYQTEKCNNRPFFKSIRKELAVPNFNPSAQRSLFRNCAAWQHSLIILCRGNTIAQQGSNAFVLCWARLAVPLKHSHM